MNKTKTYCECTDINSSQTPPSYSNSSYPVQDSDLKKFLFQQYMNVMNTSNTSSANTNINIPFKNPFDMFAPNQLPIHSLKQEKPNYLR